MLRWRSIYASPVKEPKYYIAGTLRRRSNRRPGDAHSNQEWIWAAADYEALFRNTRRIYYG